MFAFLCGFVFQKKIFNFDKTNFTKTKIDENEEKQQINDTAYIQTLA